MRRLILFILPCILVACGPAPSNSSLIQTAAMQEYATENAMETQTSMYLGTVWAGTEMAGGTAIAIMASTHTAGTAIAETMTAQPSATPIPPFPVDAPFCRPADLEISFAPAIADWPELHQMQLKNISKTPCFLRAVPQVTLVDSRGKPFAMTYWVQEYIDRNSKATATAPGTPDVLGVWPGWTAQLNLVWTLCEGSIYGGAFVRLILGGEAGQIDIPADISGHSGSCSRSSITLSRISLGNPPH